MPNIWYLLRLKNMGEDSRNVEETPPENLYYEHPSLNRKIIGLIPLEVCKGLERSPYSGLPPASKIIFHLPGRQMRDDFSNRPGRQMRGDFFQRVGPAKEK